MVAETPARPTEPTPVPPAAAPLAAAPQAVKRSMPLALSFCIGLLLAALAAWFFYSLAWFVLLLYLSVVLATILEAPVKWLCRHGLSRSFSAVMLMVGIVSAFAAAIYFLSGLIYSQIAGLSEKFQQAPQAIEKWVHTMGSRFPGMEEKLSDFKVADAVSAFVPTGPQIMNHAAGGVEIITYVVVVYFVVLYMLVDGPEHLKALRRLIPPKHRLQVTHLFDDLAVAHRGWFVANMINVASAATMTTLGLWLMGVPGAIILGVLAGLGELVPNVGPFLMALPGILTTALAIPELTLYVVGIYVLIQTVQSYTVSPLVMKLSVQLPVLATIISVIVMGVLFGFLGVVVAIPLTADLVVLWEHVNQVLEKDASDNDVVNSAPGMEPVAAGRS